MTKKTKVLQRKFSGCLYKAECDRAGVVSLQSWEVREVWSYVEALGYPDGDAWRVPVSIFNESNRNNLQTANHGQSWLITGTGDPRALIKRNLTRGYKEVSGRLAR